METKNSIPEEILTSIKTTLAEDIGSGDVTTESIIPLGALTRGQIIAKQVGIVAGLDVAEAVYHLLDDAIEFEALVEEGGLVQDRQPLALVAGQTRSLLTAERTAMNFLGRMSGIATLTHNFVETVAVAKAVILDTRKTAPGL